MTKAKTKKSPHRRKIKKFSPDGVMLQVQRALIRDLISNNSLRDSLLRQCRSFKTWRGHELPGYHNTNPDMFKRFYQVSNFLKRYVAKKDVYDEETLERVAIESFIRDQSTYGLPKVIPRYASELLDAARGIVGEILGEFEIESLLPHCRFGRRAAAGLPAAEAYLHERVKRLTYSSETQLKLFEYIVADDHILSRCIAEPQRVQWIAYTTVPKSYKAKRGVAPDTSVGGFASLGLGNLMRELLEERTHICLSRAQEFHKLTAMHASKTQKQATLDMSKASDSFTWDHIERLVPESWHKVLKAVRTEKILVGKDEVTLSSFMLMGSGHTFPLQTILFYALSQAAINLCGVHGKAYVFGDDIIMPTPVARPFAKAMAHLGFTINTDKSFWTGKFRESCGGDYYDGWDVRPAMPEGTYERVPRIELCAFYFKVVNSLLKRWDPHEIESTVTLLLSEIDRILGFVPQGIRGTHAEYSALLYDVPYFKTDAYHIASDHGKLACQQYIIEQSVPKMKTRSVAPYYWDALRQASVGHDNLWYLMDNLASTHLCTEADKLQRLFLRLPIPQVGSRNMEGIKVDPKVRVLTNLKYRPRYRYGMVSRPILGMKGQ